MAVDDGGANGGDPIVAGVHRRSERVNAVRAEAGLCGGDIGAVCGVALFGEAGVVERKEEHRFEARGLGGVGEFFPERGKLGFIDDGELRTLLGFLQRRAGDGLFQLDDAGAFARDHRDDGHAEPFAQRHQINDEAVFLRDVHHVQRDDDGDAEFEHLRGDVEVAVQVGRIHDGDDHIRARNTGDATEQEVARDGFIGRTHLQRIAAGEIDEFHRLAVAAEKLAGLFFDRHAGVIPHFLPQAGEGVENRALARVGISRDGDAAKDGFAHSRATWMPAASVLRSER